MDTLPTDTSTLPYVRYSDSVEVRQPDEEQTVAGVLAEFATLRGQTFDRHRHGLRDAHAKSHGIVTGELTVYDGLPDHLRQGLFAEPRTYPVVVRFSTAPGDLLPDGVGAFRGMAVKVIGVEGAKVLPEEADAVTQDFLLINHPVLPTGDVAAFLRAQRTTGKSVNAPEGVQEALTAVARAAAAVVRPLGADPAGSIGQFKPESHILGETYFTTAAVRYGDFLAKLSVTPVSETLQPLRGASVDTSEDSVLRDLVVAFFRDGPAEYEVAAQFCMDLETMPVEDASVRWPEDQSPYQPVARLTLFQQDAYSPARRVYGDDVLTFNPWHCLAEHRPLGSIMRVRRAGYEASSRDRHARNATPRAEPRSIDEVPD